jgi:chorismate-pyruvate lyase
MRRLSSVHRLILTIALLVVGAGRAGAQVPGSWPDSYVSRLQAFAAMQSLNAEILASRSATLSLEGWCRAHHLAADPRVVAERVPGVMVAPTAEQRVRLAIGDSEQVRYRRVRLRCGDRVLSVAENWYVPGRLTAEMNRLLDSTETPFGRVVQPLTPYRRTLEAIVLWQPLPPDWDRQRRRGSPCRATGRLAPPDSLFVHRALLTGADQRPLAEVREVYQRGILAFPAPGPC